MMMAAGVPAAAAGQNGGGPPAPETTIVAPGAKPELVAEGFSFTEGPATDRWGNVYFTDQPNDRIMRWDAASGALTQFLSPSGRANGLYFDREGDLLAAADGENALWSISPDGSHTVLARGFDGGEGRGEFNGPNDLWVHPRTGDIYFTDPLYARPYWTHRDKAMQQDGENVYRLDRRTGKVERIAEADDLAKPNGIIGSPDGRTLYVADIGGGKTWAWRVGRDGRLRNRRLFTEMGSDGMTIDTEGNVYLTGRGVTVFNRAGERIAWIEVPENWTANVTFGGADRRTLFITASDAVYTLRMSVSGVR
jgi:gluconolactonase